MAILISARNSVRPVRSTCCRTVSDFPASLPTILAHAGVKGFSTQKLSAAWQPRPKVGGPDSPEETPEGIPFNVGVWEGPDGETVLAAFNPGGYGSRIRTDLSKTPPPAEPPVQGRRRQAQETDWPKRIDIDGKATGVFADYHYVGTGDIGGAVDEESVKLLEATVTQGEAVLPPPGHAASRTPLDGTRHTRHACAHGRRPGQCDLFGGRSDVSRHQAGDAVEHAACTRAIWN